MCEREYETSWMPLTHSFLSTSNNISSLSVWRTIAACFSTYFFLSVSLFSTLLCVALNCVYLFFCCLSFHSHKQCVRFSLLLGFSIFDSLLCLTLAHFYSQFDGFAETRTVRFSASASVCLNSVIFFRSNESIRVYRVLINLLFCFFFICQLFQYSFGIYLSFFVHSVFCFVIFFLRCVLMWTKFQLSPKNCQPKNTEHKTEGINERRKKK